VLQERTHTPFWMNNIDNLYHMYDISLCRYGDIARRVGCQTLQNYVK